MNNDISVIVTELLERYELINDDLRDIIHKGCLSILDAKMITEGKIEEPYFGKSNEKAMRMPFGDSDLRTTLHKVISTIREDGFGPHILDLTGLFGRFLFYLSGTKQQQEQAQKWSNENFIGVYLMTDGGGPNIANWNTKITEIDKHSELVIDKIHAMAADRLGFGIVVAKGKTSYFPSIYLIDPERCNSLIKTAVGAKWLDGHLQLGNVKGRIPITENDELNKGGTISVNKMFSFGRPFLIKAIISHIFWLDDNKRARLSEQQRDTLKNLERLADGYNARDFFTFDSVIEVLALKFASNEVMLDLVTAGVFGNQNDRRDVLGFTKMEGSSYRCFLEIWSRRRIK